MPPDIVGLLDHKHTDSRTDRVMICDWLMGSMSNSALYYNNNITTIGMDV